ncbi:efflux RND transporter permease subunit [Rossellomorea aquimaris]|uniref:efflux RND transporter permease subunit n=1 Tax=Rossellomorea aquimaris TaxID=189382 RepID=UPI001CD55672|nr:efflux RND transporter permease subunit [Rossellomorea aquimaris]MCA1059418.1 efflux RND transporter permease subunit [Rossellomorea aquimaris]
MKISDFSIRRPVFTIITMLLILILGGVSLLKIPLKLIPDLNPPVGVVVTNYPGAGPQEVMEKVTKPLEESLSTLPGMKNIQSTSREGSNFILLEFTWSTSIDDIENDVLQRLDQTPLPDGAENPRFLKFDPAQFPIIQFSLREEGNESNLKTLSEKLKLELTRVEGVANVNVSGSLKDEVVIELNQQSLKDHRLSQEMVVNTIRANNVTAPGDTIDTNGQTLTTRVLSKLQSVDELKKLVLQVNPQTGKKITLSDVATVEKRQQDMDTITRANQEPAILFSVLQQSDANTASVSKAFQKELNRLLKQDQYQSIKADVLFDQGDYITQAIGNIANSLLIGGAFAMLVLFLFLKNVRSPLIIGVAIPYSVIVTFVLMFFADFALNIMTLGALALGIGMLVDNAIVVIENIYRHLSLGKSAREAASIGAKEVGGAITASTLTTVAVFLPVVFISGLLGELFTEFALTISFSLLASLVVALTVIPMLASRLLKKPKGNLEAKRRRSKSRKNFARSVKWALRHRFIVLFITLITLVAGGLGLTTVGTQFLPPTDEGFFNMRVELGNGASVDETNKVVKAIEKELKKEKDVDVFVSLVGTTQEESFRGSTKGNIAEVYVKMKPLEERNRSIFNFADEVKPKVEKAAQKVNKSADVSFNLQSTSGSSPQTLTFNLRDTDQNRLDKAVNKLFSSLKEMKDVSEVSTDQMETVKEVQMKVNREEALRQGLAPAQIGTLVQDVTRGVLTTQMVTEDSDVINVLVQYDRNITENLDSLKKLLIPNGQGKYIQLNSVVDFSIEDGPVSIQRIDQQHAVQFTLKYTSETNLGAISKAVDEKIESLDLPNETLVSFSGDRELLEDSIDDMALALGLAIVLVYMVMAAQFESFKYPFVIMFTVPLMVIGVAIALSITQTPISISAIIGVIVLAGIVVNNAIVIVDYINQRKESGTNSFDSIVEAVQDRARPIFMTALTTILGLLPLALGIGEGTEINQPMGIAVIGGLISSTLLTIYVIPIVYSFFDKETRRMKKHRGTYQYKE